MSETHTNAAPATPAAAPPAPAAPAPTADESFTQRLEQVEAAARAESDAAAADEEEAETPAGDAAPREPAKAATPAKAAPPDPDKERKDRLARAAQLERDNVRAKMALAHKERELRHHADQLAQKEQAITTREGSTQALEKALNDPAALLSLLAERVGPEKLSHWLVEQSQPEKVAEHRARAVAGQVSEEVKKLREELASLRAEKTREQEGARAAANRQEAEKHFSTRIEQVREEAPHVARMLAGRPGDLLRMAWEVDRELSREGLHYNQDDIILKLEERLGAFASALHGSSQQAAPQAPSKDELSRSTAAAKAPTVSNRAAAERASLLSEDEEGLPFEERIRRAEKRVRSSRVE
jgi:hypothetical protein